MKYYYFIEFSSIRNCRNTLEKDLYEFFKKYNSRVIEVAILDDFFGFLEKAVSDFNFKNPRCKMYGCRIVNDEFNSSRMMFLNAVNSVDSSLISLLFTPIVGSVDLSVDFVSKTTPKAKFICSATYNVMEE